MGWLLAIGNYRVWWALGFNMLWHLHISEVNAQPRYKRIETATAQGFLLPVNDADKYAEFRVGDRPEQSEDV